MNTPLKTKVNNGTATPEEIARYWRNVKANAARKFRDQAMRSCGLVKVRGALGGIYWE
jgi:hypothetical protein